MKQLNLSRLKPQYLFWLLCLFGLAGFRYPVVGRDAVWNDMPRSLLWWAVALAAVFAAWWTFLIRDTLKKRQAFLVMWCCFFIAAFVLAIGELFAVNGLLDRSPVQTYRTVVAGEYSVATKYGLEYYLKVADWRAPTQILTLSVDEATYDRIEAASDQPVLKVVHVETRAGFLGYERCLAIH